MFFLWYHTWNVRVGPRNVRSRNECAATLPLRKSPCCGRVAAIKIAGTGRKDRWPDVAPAEGRASPLGVGRRQAPGSSLL
jgi:hypothetical protein